MGFFKEELAQVKAFVFDLDGVLSVSVSSLDRDGDVMYTVNSKDDFAIAAALDAGYNVAIISGRESESVEKHYSKLGLKHIFMKATNKIVCLDLFLSETGFVKEQIMYMGDDLPDYKIMDEIGIPTCPADAVIEIRNLSKYVSHLNGGEGCVRDIIEQVMRSKNQWLTDDNLNKISF